MFETRAKTIYNVLGFLTSLKRYINKTKNEEEL